MTVIRIDDKDDKETEQLFDIAVSSCTDIIAELDVLRDRYRAQEDVGETEVKRALQECLRTMNHVFDHRRRFDELRKRRAGIAHDFALDFDTARSEIGRRLARLRAAGSAGELPE